MNTKRHICGNTVNDIKRGDRICGRFLYETTETDIVLFCPKCGHKEIVPKLWYISEILKPKAEDLIQLLNNSIKEII